MNLLKMTQLILSSMDGDEVNSIEDTVEASQVVDAIESTYGDIVSTIDFPDMWDFFQLTPSADTSKPTLLRIPDNIARIEYIQYDTSDNTANDLDYREVCPMDRALFVRRMDKLSALDDTTTYSYSYTNKDNESFTIMGKNNAQPNYYMTPDNRTVIFDNFDISQGSTIIGARTRCYGMCIPAFVRSDSFEIPLDLRQTQLLLNEAKAQCFVDLKQISNNKAEKRAREGWIMSQRHKNDTNASEIKDWKRKADFGRPRVR